MGGSVKNIDFHNVCRLCLKEDGNLLPLFFITDNLEYKLYKFCNIRVSIEDRLPRQICVPCVEKVNKCYRFKVQCERSDAFLRDYFDVEPQSDETDSNIADENTSTSYNTDVCSCKTEGSDKNNLDQVVKEDGDEEIQIIYSGPRSRLACINAANEDSISSQVQHLGETWVQKEEEGFRGWPPPGNFELAWQQSYRSCLKRHCTDLEEEVNQYILEQFHEPTCKVKFMQGTSKSSPTGQTPEGVSVQQKKFKSTPKKKPEEPQRDYFTRKSWSTLQAKQVQFNNELLKPEHLLLNLGLRPQPEVRIQSVESQAENTTLGNVTFKTEETQLAEGCSNAEVADMDTEARGDACETENVNIYEGIDTKVETETESNLFEAESERIPVEEYSINESIDIKEEDNYYYDETVMEYSNSESEHLNDAPANFPEAASESLVKITKEAPQVNVWHWITKHHSSDIQNGDSNTIKDLYHTLAGNNGLVTLVSNASEFSSPLISDESFMQLNGYRREVPPCYNISDDDESPSEEMVVISDVEENIVEDTLTETCDQVQEMAAVLETTGNKNENNSSKGHKCKLCGKVFKEWYQWVSHQEKHENNAVYSCKKCHKSYKQEDLLKKHVDWVHSTQELKCSECSAVVHSKRGLIRHMNSHKGLRTHRCNLCHRSFFTNCELQSHFEMHLPKQCDICKKIFSNKRSLKTHVEMHAGIGHKCTICSKIFCRKLYLMKHMKYHSEYQCDSCDRSFSDNNSLLFHKTSVHSPE